MKKRIRNLICLGLSAIMVMGLSVTVFAEEVKCEEAEIGETVYYNMPKSVVEEEPEIKNKLLISTDDIVKMNEEELINTLKTQTPLDSEEISQIVQYYKSEDFKNGIEPTYGIYDHPEWQIKPYVKSTVKSVTYATSWIGIDAYRSSVGMSKGKTVTKEISGKLGFSGSTEIKKYKPSLTAEFTAKATTTVSESQTCPAWTTMNWRPYLLFWKDTYYGKMKITTIVPSGTGIYENVWYEEHTGTDKRKITSTTEVWSAQNKTHNVNATTPAPPTGAPNVLG